MKKIYIQKPTIDQNQREDKNYPPIVIEFDSGDKQLCHKVLIKGPCEIVYDRTKTTGARCWIETKAQLITFKDTR